MNDMNHVRIAGALTIATVLALTLTAAQAERFAPPGFDLSWNTIDGGGGTSVGGSFALSGTIGQPDASITGMTGGTFSLSGGFWPGSGAPINTCPADIAPPPSGNGIVNIDDLLAVINAWGPCAGCAADINGNAAVNIDDLLAVINAWGACP